MAESIDDEIPLPLGERILEALRAAGEPRRLDALRADVRARMQSVLYKLRELEASERVRRVDGKWEIAAADSYATNSPGETEAGNAEERPAEG